MFIFKLSNLLVRLQNDKSLKQKGLDKETMKQAEKVRIKAEEEALIAKSKKEQARIEEVEARKLEEVARIRAKDSSE